LLLTATQIYQILLDQEQREESEELLPASTALAQLASKLHINPDPQLEAEQKQLEAHLERFNQGAKKKRELPALDAILRLLQHGLTADILLDSHQVEILKENPMVTVFSTTLQQAFPLVLTSRK
jgi:hypothetical protein